MSPHLKNKKILVMGLGLVGGGVGVCRWLVKQGARVTATDLRNRKELEPSLKKLKELPIKYILGRHRALDFRSANLIIKNPGVPNNSPFLEIARKHGVPIETDLSLFFQFWPGKIIGITGTKGKSTTASLIYQILKAAKLPVKIAGNIGRTPLEYIDVPMFKRSNALMILELSSFQLENLKISPQIAVLTNIYPDHLNRYRTMKDYIAAKEIIFKYQKSEDFVILNYDDPILKKLGKKIKGQPIWFSQKTIPPLQAIPPIRANKRNNNLFVFIQNNSVWLKSLAKKQKICSLANLKLVGRHNWSNILAAVAAANLSGVKNKAIQRAINQFQGIANRLELIGSLKGVRYYNDTAATTPEAAGAALTALGGQKQNIVLIAGGADKKLKFNQFVKLAKKYCRAMILLPGTATKKIKKQMSRVEIANRVIEVKTMAEAVKTARKMAQKRSIVLLSPACASFGLFKNEFDRGQQFVRTVKNLLSSERAKSSRSSGIEFPSERG